jgi:hypothetical protein
VLSYLPDAWFLARLIFDPEDGRYTFDRNIGSHANYTALMATLVQRKCRNWDLCDLQVKFFLWVSVSANL